MLDRHVDALAALAHVLAVSNRASRSDRPGDVDRIKLRDSIIALDGDRAGATRREIAVAIYGPNRVADEWSEPNGRLKAVIKRDIIRGRQLVAGSYRKLVARGTFADIA
ncbi:MAG: DNA -binding domain-containing protein [Hyphomicrobiaceae bacterium]